MKKYKRLFAFLLVFFMFAVLVSCDEIEQVDDAPAVDTPAAVAENTDDTAENTAEDDIEELTSYTYVNEDFGFSLELPLSWQEDCIIEETDIGVNFYCSASRTIKIGDEEYEAGHLFSIIAASDSDKNEDGEYYYPSYQILGSAEDFDVVAIFPTDVQYDPQDEASASSYQEMSEQVTSILETILFG